MKRITISNEVAHDIKSRILNDLLDENPEAIIKYVDHGTSLKRRMQTIEINDAGVRALIVECRISAGNCQDDYTHEKDLESLSWYNKYSRVLVKLDKAKVKIQEEDFSYEN
jgi:hypothetical protein